MSSYTVDSWEEHFIPVVNHLDPKASWQSDGDGTGIMFETFGKELDFVLKSPENRVWTYVDRPNGGTAIIAGYHIADRIGYFVTEVPRIPEEDDLFIIAVYTEDDVNQYIP